MVNVVGSVSVYAFPELPVMVNPAAETVLVIRMTVPVADLPPELLMIIVPAFPAPPANFPKFRSPVLMIAVAAARISVGIPNWRASRIATPMRDQATCLGSSRISRPFLSITAPAPRAQD